MKASFILLFFLELLVLFLLSRTLTREFSSVIYRVTRSTKIAVYMLAVFFLPGTIVHELSHFLMAKVLFVHAGTIHLLPEIAGDTVKLGTVAIGKTDPIRRFLIGVAPFLFGIIIILATMFFAVQYNISNSLLLTIVCGYVVFEIGNTMFSSKKDMEGTFKLLLCIIFIVGIFYFFGYQLHITLLEMVQLTFVSEIFEKGSFFLAIPILIDLAFIGLFALFKQVT